MEAFTPERGKHADFLILDADSPSDARNVRAIAAIYEAGVDLPGDDPIARSPDRPISP